MSPAHWSAHLHPVPGPDLCCLVPDPVAQGLWHRVVKAIDKANGTIDTIGWVTVSGEETRAQLREAADLIERAGAILERTSVREKPLSDEMYQLAPREIDSY